MRVIAGPAADVLTVGVITHAVSDGHFDGSPRVERRPDIGRFVDGEYPPQYVANVLVPLVKSECFHGGLYLVPARARLAIRRQCSAILD